MNIQDQLAKKISDELNLEEEQYEIIRYGAFAIMQISLCIIAVAVFGLLFGVMLQALIVSFSTSILRQYSGGTHASRPGSCAVIGTVVSVGLALFMKYIGNFMNVNTILIVDGISFLIAFYIINKYAPVDSKAKPIKSEAKRKKMRKRSFIIAATYLILSIVFLLSYQFTNNVDFYIFVLDISGGMLFQVFSLTIIGRSVLAKIDQGLTRVMYRR